MFVRMTCTGCQRELVLDEVMEGAHCRCHYCRTLGEVRRAVRHRESSRGPRAAHPPLASGAPSDFHAEAGQLSPAIRASRRLQTSGGGFAWTRHRIVGGGLIATAMLIAGIAWWAIGPGKGESALFAEGPGAIAAEGEAKEIGASAVATGADEESDSTLLAAGDPQASYFGVHLAQGTIGYVVDCAAPLAQYIDRLALITNSANRGGEPGKRRFGISLALDRERPYLYFASKTERSEMEGAESALSSFIPNGHTDLAKAIAATAPWYPDQVFVVLSKRVSGEEIRGLCQAVRQTGAVTHVIALGEAGRQPELAQVSGATGGRFVPVSDAELDRQVELHRRFVP